MITHSHGWDCSAAVSISSGLSPVEAEQAGLCADAVIGELGHACLDGFGYRLGVPRSRPAVRVQPDDENPRFELLRGHVFNLWAVSAVTGARRAHRRKRSLPPCLVPGLMETIKPRRFARRRCWDSSTGYM